jgi:hypothetical protein
MSYMRKPPRARAVRNGPPSALGDLASTITGLASAAGVAVELANDPYLPETVCRVGQLKAINNHQRPNGCAKARDGMPGGVGLGRMIKPLRAYVYAEQHRWVYPATVAAVVGIPFLLGLAIGRSR